MNILYSFRRCPYAMRARLALAYAQQTVVLREVSLKEKPADLLRYSPKGTVPVLITEDNCVLEESLDIMHWAVLQHDPDHWLTNLAEQEPLIHENDHVFKAKLDQYKYADRHPESEEFYRTESISFPLTLNERLSHHPYLFGKAVSLADIAIFPFIRQYAHVNLAWFEAYDWPNLVRWLNEFKRSELFTLAMKKYTPWQEGDIVTYFP